MLASTSSLCVEQLLMADAALLLTNSMQEVCLPGRFLDSIAVLRAFIVSTDTLHIHQQLDLQQPSFRHLSGLLPTHLTNSSSEHVFLLRSVCVWRR